MNDDPTTREYWLQHLGKKVKITSKYEKLGPPPNSIIILAGVQVHKNDYGTHLVWETTRHTGNEIKALRFEHQQYDSINFSMELV